ncbi:uncharacterized protein EI90DRAFT_3022272 [Cantharellus anzutake]|uniref:uncharacterized protein n=1 Tax=Cantharellus anzutake TaxID=1750568 RepID=UPI001906EB7D|nr:uncharacterized protein EI90DRAFT_3022272 [Cantharellus anzutake]KAF8314564.1 hypothetical protein EI90DRAFT_3022272 [Cantharellus anzutake]
MNGYEPHPWGIMVAGLQAQDAATLLFHQFWLSKKISFAAYPATPFTSEWLGNWAIVAGEKQKTKVLQCLKETLSLPNSVIGHYLLCTVPDSNECLEIVNSARVEPINVTRGTTTTIHWIFLAKSPHPADTEKHQKWVNAAEATEWFHLSTGTGDLCNPPAPCKCCKGRDHTTLQCPLTTLPCWPDLFPPKAQEKSDTNTNPPTAAARPHPIGGHHPNKTAENSCRPHRGPCFTRGRGREFT